MVLTHVFRKCTLMDCMRRKRKKKENKKKTQKQKQKKKRQDRVYRKKRTISASPTFCYKLHPK